MNATPQDVNPGDPGIPRDPDFPHEQAGWTMQDAERVAREDGLTLTDEHWQVIRALQEFFSRHEEGTLHVNLRELHDALDERFHAQGGIRRLYLLFPGGPVAQGCRIGGLKAPFTATDTSFGSVA